MADNFVSLGYFPYQFFFTENEEIFSIGSCDIPPKRNPLWYLPDESSLAPTGDGSPYPFSLSLREAMAMFWRVKSWRVECSIPSWTQNEESCTEINGVSINETWIRQVGFNDIEKPTDLICNGLSNGSFDLEKTFTTVVNGTTGCEEPEPIESSDSIEINSNISLFQDEAGTDYFVQAEEDLFYLALNITCGGHRSVALSPSTLTQQYFSDNEISPDNPDGFATFIIAGSEREIQIPLYNYNALDTPEKGRSAPTIKIYPFEYFQF